MIYVQSPPGGLSDLRFPSQPLSGPLDFDRPLRCQTDDIASATDHDDSQTSFAMEDLKLDLDDLRWLFVNRFLSLGSCERTVDSHGMYS
jgi:hypothetical protein